MADEKKTFLLSDLKQDATLWKNTGGANQFGTPVFENYIFIKVRWESKSKTLNNGSVISVSDVFCDRKVFAGDAIALGRHATNDTQKDFVRSISAVENIPSIDNTQCSIKAIV